MIKILGGLAVLFVVFIVIPLALTERGDYLGPLERTARAALNAWDMWDNEGVRTYEAPMPQRPEGTVSTQGRPGYNMAVLRLGDRAPDPRENKIIYDRFCRHCHGVNGDSRTIVAESFDFPLPDLRDDDVQSQADDELFWSIFHGTGDMIALKETLPPEQILMTIHHLRSLKDAPSVPFFKRK